MTRLKMLCKRARVGPVDCLGFLGWFALGYLAGVAVLTASGMIEPVMLAWNV